MRLAELARLFVYHIVCSAGYSWIFSFDVHISIVEFHCSYLVTVMGLVIPWSFTLALVDGYSVLVKCPLRQPGILAIIVVGDWVSTCWIELYFQFSDAWVVVFKMYAWRTGPVPSHISCCLLDSKRCRYSSSLRQFVLPVEALQEISNICCHGFLFMVFVFCFFPFQSLVTSILIISSFYDSQVLICRSFCVSFSLSLFFSSSNKCSISIDFTHFVLKYKFVHLYCSS